MAPTLVFLHEGLGCVSLWRDFPARLAEATGCGALVYSRAGYGRSSPVSLPRPLDYMEREGTEVLPRVLAAAGIQRALLVGHSDGGSIALVYAGATPARETLALLLEAPHVFVEERSVTGIEAAVREYRTGDLAARLRRHHGENLEGAFLGWSGAWLDPAFRRWNLERFLPGVQVPVLLVQGEDDAYGTAAQVETIARGIAGPARLRLLPGCGHAPHREQAEPVLAEMAAFVREVLA